MFNNWKFDWKWDWKIVLESKLWDNRENWKLENVNRVNWRRLKQNKNKKIRKWKWDSNDVFIQNYVWIKWIYENLNK